MFAATSTGDLLCREANTVDLVWTKIGTVPANTFNLAAYYGRLFTLTGSTASAILQWRSAVASVAYKTPSLLFVNRAGGAGVATLAGNGDVVTTGTGIPSIGFLIVCRANDGLVFFYRSDGSASLGRFSPGAIFTNVKQPPWPAGSYGTWNNIVYVNNGTNEHVFFYDTSRTLGFVGRFNATTGDFIEEWSSNTFSTGWTNVASANSGYLLFYNRNNGTYAVGTIATNGAFSTVASGTIGPSWDRLIAVGQTFILFYKGDGSAALFEYANGTLFSLRSWTADNNYANAIVGSNSNGVALFLFSNGRAIARGFYADGDVILRDFPAGSFGSWSTFLAIGVL